MNIPPVILDLRVAPPDRRPVRLWLPVFLLWPLFLALGLLALGLTVVVDIVLLVRGERYHHYTVLLVRSFEALTETRGTVIHINDDKANVDLTFL